MKTKMLMSFFTLGFMLFSTFSCKSNQPQNNFSDEQILGMLKSFYTSYIIEDSKMPTNYEKLDSIKSKYCTANLLNKIENQFKKQELDYDPFLNAQDCDIEWLKTLTIRKDTKKSNLYYVSYADNYNNTKITIRLIVVKEKECYKIDSVW